MKFIVMAFALALPSIAQAEKCIMDVSRIRQIGLNVFCGEFHNQQNSKTKGKTVVPDAADKTMAEICKSEVSMKMVLGAGAGAATAGFASNYFVKRIMVKKMLPFVTDDIVNSFMKETGMTDDALRSWRLGEGKDAAKMAREAIRIELAKHLVQQAGFSIVPPSTEKLEQWVKAGSEKLYDAKGTFHWVSNHSDHLFQQTMMEGAEDFKAKIAEAAATTVAKAKNYVASAAFAAVAAGAMSKFNSSLGMMRIPLKVKVRLPVGLLAGGALTALAIETLTESVDSIKPLGCSDKPALHQIVDRDPKTNCRIVEGMTSQVIVALTNAQNTAGILVNEPQACEAYAKLYREYALGLPAKTEDLKIACNGNQQTVEWESGTIQGYRSDKTSNGMYKVSVKIKKDYRTPPKWHIGETIQTPYYRLPTSELASYCAGDKNNALGPAMYDEKAKPETTKTPATTTE